ncbi:transposase [Auritidibacter ignavus]|nr:transposase [Auritidibacter ignavus]
MSIQAISRALGLGWDLVNQLATTAAQSLVYTHPDHLVGVRVLGIDEHCWKHVRGQGEDSFATIFVDLTPLIDGTGRARLLDMKAGRSANVVTTWLQEQSPAFRAGVEVVTMDGFAGYHTATTHALPDAVPVMGPFHVVQLAGQKLTACRQRLKQQIHGHRGRKTDLLYQGRRTLLTRRSLLNKRGRDRLERLWVEHDDHVALEVTDLVYQDGIEADEQPDRKTGKKPMQAVVNQLRRGLPQGWTSSLSWGADVVAETDSGAGVLRSRWRVERSGRSDQRTLRSPARYRAGVRELRALCAALPAPLRAAISPAQRTLKPEEPIK